MRQLPSRLRRLDDALADLPLDEPMLLTELDGFLTGLLVGPEPILPGEWLPFVWGEDEAGGPPFDEPADVQWFTDALMARCDEIVRDLERGRLQPIFDVDERNGDVLWDMWVDGLRQSMAFRPDDWAGLADGDEAEAAEAVAGLSMLIGVATGESTLMSHEINALHDDAPGLIPLWVDRLYRRRLARHGGPATAPARVAKIGRNDACPCGSGKKFKRCCGSA